VITHEREAETATVAAEMIVLRAALRDAKGNDRNVLADFEKIARWKHADTHDVKIEFATRQVRSSSTLASLAITACLAFALQTLTFIDCSFVPSYLLSKHSLFMYSFVPYPSLTRRCSGPTSSSASTSARSTWRANGTIAVMVGMTMRKRCVSHVKNGCCFE
jgi:hypothetical protein